MKAAKDGGADTTTPRVKTTSEEEARQNSALWEEHFKDQNFALDKALKCVEDQY